jgi:DNA processing protein
LAKDISRTIIEHGGLVVSGLAQGVDSIAHRTAIECSGRTIAVLGTPLSQAYPRENSSLQQEIMDQHLVVSQFPEDHPVQPKNFILRNRTMALISHGSIIVEAGEKSGTQHQGWEAIRLGRLLFLPRSLCEAPFDWPRQMMKYGAHCFDSVSELSDLLAEFLPSSVGFEDVRGFHH